MGANEKVPAKPIAKAGYPGNRVWQRIDGKDMKVGTVIPVGGNDDWWNLARAHQLQPWEIIWFNFETCVPEEVNWYLRNYVGCRSLSPTGRNYTFKGAFKGGRPGEILMPFGWAVLEKVLERERRRRPRPESPIRKHWPQIDEDATKGRSLVERQKKVAHLLVSEWAWNDLAFDIRDEGPAMLDSPSPSVGASDLLNGVLKVFKELDPAQKQLARRRLGLYDAYAAGFAAALFPEFRVDRRDMTAEQRVFFDKGTSAGKRLSSLDRYRFVVGLIDADRTSGFEGFNPIPRSVSYFERRASGSDVRRMLYRQMQRLGFMYRNVRSARERAGR